MPGAAKGKRKNGRPESGPRKKGKYQRQAAVYRNQQEPMQQSEKHAIINCFYVLKDEDEEENICRSDFQVRCRVADLFGRSESIIGEVLKLWGAERRVTPTPTKKKVKKCPITNVDSFCKEALCRFICTELNNRRHVTIDRLFEETQNNMDIYNFKGKNTSLLKIVKSMGFVYSKGDRFERMRESDEIYFKRSCFLREYVKNLESEHPKLVVFLDETWIYKNGSSTCTWNKPGSVEGAVSRPAEGGRLVILHAGSRKGFIPGGDLIFATDLKTGQDYHGAMNSDTFLRWTERQLIEGMKNLGKCLVVLDNASYHSTVVDKQPTTKWRKHELISWLQQNGVPVPEYATRFELQGLCNIYKSNLKRYAFDEMLRKEGHSVLRLPPYHSFFNPIEMVWSVTKQYFNKHVVSRSGSGFNRAKAVWQEALKQVTEEVWMREIDHAEKTIMDYYNKEVRGEPEVEEIIIQNTDSDYEEEVESAVGDEDEVESGDEDVEIGDEEDEELATPLEPVAGCSKFLKN